MEQFKPVLGELLGTFILVFIGCGSVGLAVICGTFETLLEVALVWGLGVALGIFASRKLSPAHLNPAVSFAFWMKKEIQLKELFLFSFSQLIGAFLAGFALYFLFQNAIISYENSNDIVRGTEISQNTAMMFGEFFPNPGYADQLNINVYWACVMEALGTFILILAIFRLIAIKKLHHNLLPILIGLTVTIIICFVAPYTQAGLNPARDFGPRLVAYLMGWGDAAFPSVEWGFLTVYILSPIVGGILAFLINNIIDKRKNHSPRLS